MAVTTSASIAPPPGLAKPGANGAAKKEADHDLAALPFGQLLQGLADDPQAEAHSALAALAQLAAATPGAKESALDSEADRKSVV